MNQSILEFTRLLSSTECLIERNNLSDVKLKRIAVYVSTLQTKIKELESAPTDHILEDDKFFLFTRRVNSLKLKLHERTSTPINLDEECDIRQGGEEQEEQEEQEEEESESSCDDENESNSELISEETTTTTSSHHIVDSSIASSMTKNKIEIEEQRKKLEISENEKHQLLDNLVGMAAVLKGEATNINVNLIDQNTQLSKLAEKAEATSTHLGGEVKNLNNHFRKQIVSSCGGVVHILVIVLVFFFVTMFMRFFPRRFSLLS